MSTTPYCSNCGRGCVFERGANTLLLYREWRCSGCRKPPRHCKCEVLESAKGRFPFSVHEHTGS